MQSAKHPWDVLVSAQTFYCMLWHGWIISWGEWPNLLKLSLTWQFQNFNSHKTDNSMGKDGASSPGGIEFSGGKGRTHKKCYVLCSSQAYRYFMCLLCTAWESLLASHKVVSPGECYKAIHQSTPMKATCYMRKNYMWLVSQFGHPIPCKSHEALSQVALTLATLSHFQQTEKAFGLN